MPTLDERVAFLEGRVGEHGKMLDGIREAIVHLEERMDRRFATLEERFDRRFAVLEARLTVIEARFTAIDARFTAIDARVAAGERRIDSRIDTLDARMARQFTWLVGLHVTTLVAIVAALIAR